MNPGLPLFHVGTETDTATTTDTDLAAAWTEQSSLRLDGSNVLRERGGRSDSLFLSHIVSRTECRRARADRGVILGPAHLTLSLSGSGILHRLLRPVSPAKPPFAALRSGWLRKTFAAAPAHRLFQQLS